MDVTREMTTSDRTVNEQKWRLVYYVGATTRRV